MLRGWRVAALAAFLVNLGLVVQAESNWHLPRPKLWPAKWSSDRPPAEKKTHPVQPASAWFPFEVKPKQQAKAIALAPVNLAKKVGHGSMDLFDRTRDTLAAPFRSHDLPPVKKTPKKAAKKPSIFANPFAKREPAHREVETLTDFLKQPRPGFD